MAAAPSESTANAEENASAAGAPPEKQPLSVEQFPYLQVVPTRWHDNDVYGHINNTIYYSVMDTAVNTWMIGEAGLDPERSPVIGVVISSSCEYRASAAFPDTLKLGVACARLGTSSVVWRTGVFLADGDKPLAEGRFVHVFVDRETMRPVPIPERIRGLIEQRLVVAEPVESEAG